jgi:hypothetical protein
MDATNSKPLGDSQDWYWTNHRSGTQAMDVLDKRLGKSVEYFRGQADEV